MKKTLFALAISSALVCGSAQAGDKNWYGIAAFGSSIVSNTNLKEKVVDVIGEPMAMALSHPLISSVGYSLDHDKSDFAVKAILGYKFNDYFAVEGGYYYLGKTKADGYISANGINVFRGKASMKGQMIGLDAVGIWPVADKFSLFGKAGLGVAFTKTSVSFADTTGLGISGGYSKSKTRLCPKLGAGFEFDINEYVAIRAEYEYVFKASKDSDRTMKADYNIITAGIKFKF